MTACPVGLRRRAHTYNSIKAFAVVGTLILAACSDSRQHTASQAAPGFSLRSLKGTTVRLSDFKGQVVLIDFWASWCGPCKLSVPHLVELQEEYRSEGFVVLGLSLDTDPEALREFLGRTYVNYEIFTGIDDNLRMAYGGVSSLPEAFLVDKMGKVRQRFMGFSSETARRMERGVQSLLSEDAQL